MNEVLTEKEDVTYIKYYTQSFFIRLGEESLDKLKEKVDGMTDVKRNLYIDEFVKTRMRKVPDMAVNGEDYDNSAVSLGVALFGIPDTVQKTLGDKEK